jgi:hypothetical protein
LTGDVLTNIGIDNAYAILRGIVYAGTNDIVQGDIDDVFLFNISDFCENIGDFCTSPSLNSMTTGGYKVQRLFTKRPL